MKDYSKYRIIMCYEKRSFSPGRYLEDALRSIGVLVSTYTKDVDFKTIDVNNYSAVLFVETNTHVQVKHINNVKIPKLFWVHNGPHRIDLNVQMSEAYQPDLVLMAHSLNLADRFTVPVRFFPFAMDKHIFNCNRPLDKRYLSVAFVGNKSSRYKERNNALQAIYSQLKHKGRVSLFSKFFLRDLSRIYGNAKIVFNDSPKNLQTMNMRIFEGMGCGALVLTSYVPGQEKLFIDGKHYVIFHDTKDLLQKIDYYLSNLNKAQEIAKAGHLHLLKHHTYEHRAMQIIDYIDQMK